jgi:KaiC/GvpD/RAD55 family RecA-like ATPase
VCNLCLDDMTKKIGSAAVSKVLRQQCERLSSGWISLIQLPPMKHMNVNTEVLRVLINELKYTCIYITFTKSYPELDKTFKESGINTAKILYIDAISKMYGTKEVHFDRCTYVAGPLDIEAITVALRSQFSKLQGKKTCVFLDSVTTLLLYNSMPRTLRFSQFLTKTIREMGFTGVMLSLAKGVATKKLATELASFCDEVVEVVDKESNSGKKN